MKRSRTVLYLLFTDWCIVVGSFIVAMYFRPYDKGMNLISRHHVVPEIGEVFLYAILVLGVFSMLGLYKRKILFLPFTHFFNVLRGSVITILFYALLNVLLKADYFVESRWVLIQWGFLLVTGLTIHRLYILRLLYKIFSQANMSRRVVVIGDTELSKQFVEECKNTPDCGIQVIGMMAVGITQPQVVDNVPFLGVPSILPESIPLYNLEGAVICNPELSHQRLMDLAEKCIQLFGWVDIHSDNSSALQKADTADAFFDIPFIRMHGISDNLFLKVWKRGFDFVAALLGIFFLLPLLIGTAIAIKLNSSGPVFYIKKRVGKNGKLFDFYKFRSMAVGADQDETRNGKIKEFIQKGNGETKMNKVVNTAYVTSVGKFIRKWAIDELPQLFNVLKGDMALVGPRPVPQNEYDLEDEWHRQRFRIPPGCTGLWKLYASKEGVTFNETALYDIYYSRNMNPAMDLMIIFGTVFLILRGRADG